VWNAPGARAVFTLRTDDGVSEGAWASLNVGDHVGDDWAHVLTNRTRAAARLDLEPEHVAMVRQVHGADVWMQLPGDAGALDERMSWASQSAGEEVPVADALVTAREGVGLAVVVADCLPIAVSWGRVIAAIHGGWRSLAGGVVEATLHAMRVQLAADVARADVAAHAFIGPGICAQCMEVGEEVAAQCAAASVVRGDARERPRLDLRADAERRLRESGVEVVEHLALCTMEDERCFSHRRSGPVTGRSALIVRRG
jgi:YfiH family protein